MNSRSGDSRAECDAILSWLRPRENEVARLLADLVSIPTENPQGKSYRPCVNLLETRLREAGLDCERLQSDGFTTDAEYAPDILVATHGTGERTLYFHGHYDVVPAQSPAQFHPQIKEHFLFGRGSADMKSGIVAMLYAIHVLKQLKLDLKGEIKLILVPNEETGGSHGTGWLAQQGMFQRDGVGMLLAEPTSGVVWNANRGAISLRVRVFGKSAHVGFAIQSSSPGPP